MTTTQAGGSRCPPILSREEIARRRREDEQRRLRVVEPERSPSEINDELREQMGALAKRFSRERKGRA